MREIYAYVCHVPSERTQMRFLFLLVLLVRGAMSDCLLWVKMMKMVKLVKDGGVESRYLYVFK